MKTLQEALERQESELSYSYSETSFAVSSPFTSRKLIEQDPNVKIHIENLSETQYGKTEHSFKEMCLSPTQQLKATGHYNETLKIQSVFRSYSVRRTLRILAAHAKTIQRH